MAEIDKTVLHNKIDTNISIDGSNKITGAKLNEVLKDIVDSYANKIDEAQLLDGNIGEFADFENEMEANIGTITT